MNKIISMSVWGSNPRYIIGAKRQYELAKKYYPDWKVRIYTDNTENFKSLFDIDLIEVKDNTSGYFWRFRALFESQDNIILIRDSDGRITLREQLAVIQWLSIDKSFHTFKDHEAHYEFPVMAGTFGFKGALSDTLYNIMKDFEHNTFYYTNDQVYLRDYVWKEIYHDSFIHSMYEGWFGETRKKLKNKYSFCGNGYDENDMPIYPDCLNATDFNKDNINNKFDEGLLNE